MELKIKITQQQHLFDAGEYLVAEIYLNGHYFKEVIPEQNTADMTQLLECVVHSLLNDVEFKNIKL